MSGKRAALSLGPRRCVWEAGERGTRAHPNRAGGRPVLDTQGHVPNPPGGTRHGSATDRRSAPRLGHPGRPLRPRQPRAHRLAGRAPGATRTGVGGQLPPLILNRPPYTQAGGHQPTRALRSTALRRRDPTPLQLLSEHTHEDPRRPGACAAGDAITGDMVWATRATAVAKAP